MLELNNKLNENIDLCHIDDIEEGASKGFLGDESGSDLLFIVKQDGQLFGWRNACPHVSGAPMAWRKDAYMNSQQTFISCHAHGALFEPNTGLCVQGPCLGKSLKPVPVYVNQAGKVSILSTDIR